MAYRLLVRSLTVADAVLAALGPGATHDRGPEEDTEPGTSAAEIAATGLSDVTTPDPSQPDGPQLDSMTQEALLLRARAFSLLGNLSELDGWLARAERSRQAAAADYDVLLSGVRADGTVSSWAEQLESGEVDATLAPILVVAGRLHREAGDRERATALLQGALLLSSATHDAELAAMTFVELADAMPDDHVRSAGFLERGLECLTDAEPHELRTRAYTRLAEEHWRAGRPQQAEVNLVRAEDDASARGDAVRLAECRSLRGDAALARGDWAVASARYIEFADFLVDAYPLYVAGRMAHRALALLDSSLVHPDAEELEHAHEASQALVQYGQVALGAHVDALREQLPVPESGDVTAAGGHSGPYIDEDDRTAMGNLCGEIGHDLAVIEARLCGGEAPS